MALMSTDVSRLLTMSQVAARLGKSRAWAHKLREMGEFPSAEFVGDRYLVDPADVDAYLTRERKHNNGTTRQ